MGGGTFTQELTKEMVGKTITWGPAIAGAVLLGPVGIALGVIASAVIIKSLPDDAPPSGNNPPKD